MRRRRTGSAPGGVETDDAEGRRRNPFRMPPEGELFTLRETERRRAKEERSRERKLEVHEKSTYSSRLCANTAALRRLVMDDVVAMAPGPDDEAGNEGGGSREKVHDDTEFVLATTKDKHVEKEDLVGYVARKREMFLLQYSLGVKKDEIKKLEEISQVRRSEGGGWVVGGDGPWPPLVQPTSPLCVPLPPSPPPPPPPPPPPTPLSWAHIAG